MTFTIQALTQWIALGEQILNTGQDALTAVKAAAVAHGIEQDTAQLDAVILDASLRRAMAIGQAEANKGPNG